MDQTFYKKFYRYVVCIFLATTTFFCSLPVPIHALENSVESPSRQEFAQAELQHFEEMLDIFEAKIQEEEAEIDNSAGSCPDKRGIFSKWQKNIKKWFKKKVFKMMKRYAGLRKCKTKDDLAKSFVKFKKKIDRKLYNTGKLEKVLAAINTNSADETSQVFIQDFKDRVRFHYYKKKSEKNIPSNYRNLVSRGLQEERQGKNHLEGYTTQQVVGGLEIFCGVLIGSLPLPGCTYLGGVIAADGLQRLISEGIKKIDEPQNITKT